jgi:hypothetical protein
LTKWVSISPSLSSAGGGQQWVLEYPSDQDVVLVNHHDPALASSVMFLQIHCLQSKISMTGVTGPSSQRVCSLRYLTYRDQRPTVGSLKALGAKGPAAWSLLHNEASQGPQKQGLSPSVHGTLIHRRLHVMEGKPEFGESSPDFFYAW